MYERTAGYWWPHYRHCSSGLGPILGGIRNGLGGPWVPSLGRYVPESGDHGVVNYRRSNLLLLRSLGLSLQLVVESSLEPA